MDKLVATYHYSPEMRALLFKIITCMIEQYGEDKKDIILKALEDCPIIICDKGENIYDLLVKHEQIDHTGDTIVSEGDLKRASGVYSSNANIIYDESSNSYKITSIKRILGLSSYFDIKNTSSIANLVHEIGHLVKSYIDEYKIEGDVLIARDGLIETKYKLSLVDGKVSKKVIEEKCVGIEEGTNSLDELEIINNHFDEYYKIHGYGVVTEIGKIVANKFELKKDIHNAQFYAQKSDLIDKYNNKACDNSFERLESLTDELVKLEYKRFSYIFDTPKMNETTAIISEQIDKIKNVLNEYHRENVIEK
jgi:hypothetical protein